MHLILLLVVEKLDESLLTELPFLVVTHGDAFEQVAKAGTFKQSDDFVFENKLAKKPLFQTRASKRLLCRVSPLIL